MLTVVTSLGYSPWESTKNTGFHLSHESPNPLVRQGCGVGSAFPEASLGDNIGRSAEKTEWNQVEAQVPHHLTAPTTQMCGTSVVSGASWPCLGWEVGNPTWGLLYQSTCNGILACKPS